MNWQLGAGLDGRGVIVTGAAKGIGQAVAQAVAAAGGRVLAVDVADQELKRTVKALPGPGPHLAMIADVADLTTHQRIIQDGRDTLEGVYALVHAAAILRRRHDLVSVTEDDWDAQHAVNLKSTFFLCRAVAEHLRAAGTGGRIVTFASQAWWTGSFGGGVAYAASKGGVVSLSRGLARCYAPHGVTVNVVAPGIVDTEMFHRGLNPEQVARLVQDVPLGRLATPEEVASCVVFLASRHAGYVTGATLNVSGGMLMY